MKKNHFFSRYSACLLCSLWFFQPLFSFNDLTTSNPKDFSLGDVYALSEELQNPANLSFQENQELGLSVLNRFQIKELNTGSFYWKHPNRLLNYGFKLSAFGYEDYQIISSQTSLSKKINAKIGIGINLVYFNQSSLLEENAKHFFSSGIGFYSNLNQKIDWAFSVDNLLSTSSSELPISVHSGVKYSPYPNTFFLLEGSYRDNDYFNLSVGFEYFLLEQFILRTGFKTNPKTPSLGIGYVLDKWKIDAGFSLHSTLGISSVIGISYTL